MKYINCASVNYSSCVNLIAIHVPLAKPHLKVYNKDKMNDIPELSQDHKLDIKLFKTIIRIKFILIMKSSGTIVVQNFELTRNR